ncbi:hypothetical protein ACE1SV_70660 [Streptomyces sp. E-15]
MLLGPVVELPPSARGGPCGVGQLPLCLCFVAAAVPTLAASATALVRPRRTVRAAAPTEIASGG